MALISGEIALPTTLDGERVACLFPVIGGAEHNHFVEADVVTVAAEDGHGNAIAWRIIRFTPTSSEGIVVSSGAPINSFPEAIRIARKNAGWG